MINLLYICMICTIFTLSKAFISEDINESTLVQVHIIFRHGDRAPVSLYPNDPHINDTWYPEGLEALTNYGKMQEYDIGKGLRKRYGNFLGNIYTPDVIYALSTDFLRTRMSLELVLAGLFPPEDPQIWNNNLLWQPIPYDYVSWAVESVLRLPLLSCKKYADLYNEAFKEKVFQDFWKSNSEIIQYISQKTGIKFKTFTDVYEVYNTLNSEMQTGRLLPEWTKKVFPEFLEQVAKMYYKLLTYTNELRKYSGGLMVKKILADARSKQNRTLDPKGRKIFLYSGSEYNVAYILAALNVFDHSIPPYGSYVIIEVHNIFNEYSFKILYQKSNYTTSEPHWLIIPGCERLCQIDKFAELIKSVIPDENEKCV